MTFNIKGRWKCDHYQGYSELGSAFKCQIVDEVNTRNWWFIESLLKQYKCLQSTLWQYQNVKPPPRQRAESYIGCDDFGTKKHPYHPSLTQPPYSLNFTPCDFVFWFLEIQTQKKGHYFCTVENVKSAMMRALNSLSHKDFITATNNGRVTGFIQSQGTCFWRWFSLTVYFFNEKKKNILGGGGGIFSLSLGLNPWHLKIHMFN